MRGWARFEDVMEVTLRLVAGRMGAVHDGPTPGRGLGNRSSRRMPDNDEVLGLVGARTVDATVERLAPADRHYHSSSSNRRTAGASGSLLLTHNAERPD